MKGDKTSREEQRIGIPIKSWINGKYRKSVSQSYGSKMKSGIQYKIENRDEVELFRTMQKTHKPKSPATIKLNIEECK